MSARGYALHNVRPQLSFVFKGLVHDKVSVFPYPDDHMPFPIAPVQFSFFGDECDFPFFFVSYRPLFAMMKDREIIGLRYAHELTIIQHRPHHTTMVQFLHRRRDAKTEMEKVIFFIVRYFI